MSLCLQTLIDLYTDVLLSEDRTWLDEGAVSSGCWTKGGKYVAPESLLRYLAQKLHNLGQIKLAAMINCCSHHGWNP